VSGWTPNNSKYDCWQVKTVLTEEVWSVVYNVGHKQAHRWPKRDDRYGTALYR